MIRKLIDNVSGIHVVELNNGLNIWFDPGVNHSNFFRGVKLFKINYRYMGIDEVEGRHGDCYFFYFSN